MKNFSCRTPRVNKPKFVNIVNYLAVVPSVAWDFLFDKHINLPNLHNLAVVPLMGGLNLKTLKFSFVTKNEHEASQLNRTKVKQKNLL